MEKQKKVKVFNNSKNELPSYATPDAAGFDLRAQLNEKGEYMGNMWTWNMTDDSVILQPGGRVLIPTDLHMKIPEGYELQIRPRSGLAIKHGITVLNSPGTVDHDYLGNVGVILLNTGLMEFEIKQGDRIAQAVLNKVEQVQWKEVNSIEELGETERGQGGFGHTGTK